MRTKRAWLVALSLGAIVVSGVGLGVSVASGDQEGGTPVQIIGGEMNNVGGGVTVYTPLFGSRVVFAESPVQQTVPVSGVLGDFSVHTHQDPRGSMTFTVRCADPGGSSSSCQGLGVGPNDTGVACTISATNTNCTDTSGATTFAFSAGELIAIKIVSAADAGGSPAQWTASYAPTPAEEED